MRALVITLLLVACSKTKQFDESKVERTHILVKKHAFESYPQWAAAHVDKACPDSIAELAAYGASVTDEWGHQLVLYCGANVPAGAKVLAVKSLGPDGQDNTADDIKSWE